MAKTNPFGAYCLYLALKNHFTQPNYDYTKYSGKVTASLDSFNRRRDKFQFHKLGNRFYAEELKAFLIANLSHNPQIWVGDLLSEDAQKVYTEYLRRNQSLSYIFMNDLETLKRKVNPKELFSTKEFPLLLTYYLDNTICIETVIILNDFIEFFPKFDNMGDEYLWPEIKLKAKKLKTFLKYDRDKFKNILKESFLKEPVVA